jgi:zinc and cadmium transporter
MVLHEFPEGVVTFLLLERASFSRKNRFYWLFWQQPFPHRWERWFPFRLSARLTALPWGCSWAVSAGALVYVVATHLLPAVE